MFSERLENLIRAALQDGVLTDQEKASIVKRAQIEGEDIDEVEIYIQSLMQKRQQELNKKNKEANNVQAKETQNQEKERAKTLRKCPKCGEYVPHLTNICPACGFIIDKSDKDDKIVLIKSMLKECLDSRLVLFGDEIRYDRKWKDITREQFGMFPNCYDSPEKRKSGLVHVRYNVKGIIEEASLYKDNEEISSLINQFPVKEAGVYCKSALSCLKKPKKKDLEKAKTFLSVLKDKYSDIATQEIISLEEKVCETEAYLNSFEGKIKNNIWWIILILLLIGYFIFSI